MKRLFLLLLLGVFFGCEPEWEEPFEVFLLPKGKHTSGYPVQMLQSSTLNATVYFDESAKYECNTEENQWDTNKLIGFSDCNSHHHENSARFGWRWLDSQLELLAYCYVDGETIIQELDTIPLNTQTEIEIRLLTDSYDFYISNEKLASIPRSAKTCKTGAYYMLFPYFGGDETAPHDISIYLRLNY